MDGWRRLTDRQEPRAVATRAQWDGYAAWLRRQLAVSLGLAPMAARGPVALHRAGAWQTTGKWQGKTFAEGEGYVCERAWLEPLPGFCCTGNLYRPLHAKPPYPVILCPHGHWQEGRLHDYDPRGSVVARCLHLARMGAIVFSYDMLGYNDSSQLGHRDLAEDHPWGLSTMGLQTWTSLRALDALLALPEADPTRVAITGASGGGTQTFILAALDERITVSAPICMVSYTMQGGCVCENAPLLRFDATNVDIAALFAPKPQFLGSCTGDWTRETPDRELPFVRRIYGLHEAADRVGSLHVDDEHNFNRAMREQVYGFLQRWLFGGSDAPQPEGNVIRPPLRDRLVWYGRVTPPALAPDALQPLWRAQQQAALTPLLRDPTRLAGTLVPLLPHVLGLNHLGRPCRTSQPARHTSFRLAQDALHCSGQPELRPAPTDCAMPATYNPSPLVAQVWEILDAVAETPAATRLVGADGAGPAALLAASVCPQVQAVDADLDGFADDEAGWARLFATPCLRQIGGLRPVLAALAGRAVTLHRADIATG
jgi:dienelactone hydrolase